jgi:hypothetical protein
VAYSIPLTTNSGASTEGCLAATATTCPSAVVTGPTASPYPYPFFLVSNSGQVVQCRSGPLPANADSNACGLVVGAGAFPVEIAQVGSPAQGVLGATLGGCAAAGPFTGCPAGYIGAYTSANGATTITSCIPTPAMCTAPSTVPLYGADAELLGCANALTACVELFSSANIPMNNGATTVGCMNPSSTKCPASTYTFSLYGGSGLVPVLAACTVVPASPPACDATYPVPITTTFTALTSATVTVSACCFLSIYLSFMNDECLLWTHF